MVSVISVIYDQYYTFMCCEECLIVSDCVYMWYCLSRVKYLIRVNYYLSLIHI